MKDKILKLRKEGKSYNEIAKTLNCSKGTISYHCSRNKIKKEESKVKKLKLEKKCIVCDKYFDTSIKSQTTCSKECRKVFRRQYMKGRNYEYANLVNWRLENKKKSIEYKGGKCIICGYNKCLRSLDFHHLDPNEKEFSISKNKNRKFENIIPELNKCILVCSNCHGEIHEGITKISEFITT